MVDLDTGRTSQPSDVWLLDGRVERLVGTATTPRSGNVLDVGGRFVIPGLIDTHMHLAMDTRDDPMSTYERSTDGEILRQVVVNARTALRAGVTCVRDCGTPRRLLARIKQTTDALPDMPTIVHVGAPICRPGGHGHLFGGEVRERSDIETIVAEQRANGASWVKVMVSGGGMTAGTRPGAVELDPALLADTVAIAKHHGMLVAAHCHASAAMAASIDAGVHTVEHASMLDGHDQTRPDRDLLRRAADVGVCIGPTVVAARIVANNLRAGRNRTNPDDRNAIQRLEARFTNLAEFLHADVPIIAGTDAGPAHVGFDLLPSELELYVEAGMSTRQALRSATCDAADRLGVGSDIGHLRPGWRADLVVTEADPLKDITTLRAPHAVVKNATLWLPSNEC
ncbi:amidohydrolase family protein [Streptomyces sp. NBC_00145]|uniref:amidohydrolase family protein n=1 Tax=Streptomyces sp. NBC_00145 TaxID=2975666 RepID=UPI002E18E938